MLCAMVLCCDGAWCCVVMVHGVCVMVWVVWWGCGVCVCGGVMLFPVMVCFVWWCGVSGDGVFCAVVWCAVVLWVVWKAVWCVSCGGGAVLVVVYVVL